jgi:hypothetical protein
MRSDCAFITLGVPKLHILHVKGENGTSIRLELSGDFESVFGDTANVA